MEHNEHPASTENRPIENQETPRQWETPTFERVPLNEALFGGSNGFDGDGWEFS